MANHYQELMSGLEPMGDSYRLRLTELVGLYSSGWDVCECVGGKVIDRYHVGGGVDGHGDNPSRGALVPVVISNPEARLSEGQGDITKRLSLMSRVLLPPFSFLLDGDQSLCGVTVQVASDEYSHKLRRVAEVFVLLESIAKEVELLWLRFLGGTDRLDIVVHVVRDSIISIGVLADGGRGLPDALVGGLNVCPVTLDDT